jgi:hypothetical protein
MPVKEEEYAFEHQDSSGFAYGFCGFSTFPYCSKRLSLAASQTIVDILYELIAQSISLEPSFSGLISPRSWIIKTHKMTVEKIFYNLRYDWGWSDCIAPGFGLTRVSPISSIDQPLC